MYRPDSSLPCNEGTQDIYSFKNGYKASVVRGPRSYGGDRGLFELAVLYPGLGIVYDTPITSDVIGNLTEKEVQKILAKVDALPVRTPHRDTHP